MKTREPEDEQLCKLSAPYKEIECILTLDFWRSQVQYKTVTCTALHNMGLIQDSKIKKESPELKKFKRLGRNY